jgi:hypothetical protein
MNAKRWAALLVGVAALALVLIVVVAIYPRPIGYLCTTSTTVGPCPTASP